MVVKNGHPSKRVSELDLIGLIVDEKLSSHPGY